jgi:hypothetical protein
MLRARIERAIGDETVDVILYHENDGTLTDRDEHWREFGSLADLPDQPLDGWEELLVYTSRHVYRWVLTGYANGPTTVPRHPEAILDSTEHDENGVSLGRLTG